MSIPKEPRQMMINMMYLVLTALLALNISAEILNAFYSVNDSIKAQTIAFDAKNKDTYALLTAKAANNPEKAKTFTDAANKISKISHDFNSYVQSLKDLLIAKVNGDSTKETSLEQIPEAQARNLEASTNLFVNKKKGDELFDHINTARKDLLDVIGTISKDKQAEFEKSLTLKADKPTDDKENRSWAEKNFEMVPSIAALIVLNSIQSNMKNSEADIVNWLTSQIGGTDFKFDRLKGSIIPKKPFITVGEKFQADIFVSASSSSLNPQVYIGALDHSKAVPDANGDYPELADNPVQNPGQPQDAVGGVYAYEEQPGGEGSHTVEGAVGVKNESTGETKFYPFHTEYTSSKPMAVVSADAMNVLYIGVDNPMSISVPGFSPDVISAHIDQGNITGSKGKYTATVSTPTAVGADCKVSVSAKKDDGTVMNVGAVPFRVKRVPDPLAKLGKGPYEKGGKVQAGTFKAQTGIRAELENFVFDLKFSITSYTVTYVAKRQDPISKDNTGAVYNSAIQDYVNKAKPGDAFYFDNIKAKGPDGTPRSLPSLVFQLI